MKLVSWNLENFFINLDKYNNEDLNIINNEKWENFSSSIYHKNKPLDKIENIANIIKDIDADIFLLQEVGGKKSLDYFNNLFLNNKYQILMNSSNSIRGIDLGFLVPKKSNYNYQLISNKSLRTKNGSKISRDFAQLNVLDQNKNLKFIIINVHLKSQHSTESDYNGMKQREQEMNLLLSFTKELENFYGVPIIIGGDFNIDFNSIENYNIINYYTNYHDLKNSTIEDRCTHVYFSQTKVLNQLDYLLINKKYDYLINLDNSIVYRFKNEYGDNLGIPNSINEKKAHPSDHFPIILHIFE